MIAKKKMQKAAGNAPKKICKGTTLFALITLTINLNIFQKFGWI